MNQPLRILHIEDSVADSELIGHLLWQEGLKCDIHRIQTRTELFDALQSGCPDLILADLTLPQFSGMQALEISRALKPEVPFIFVSGTMGEEKAIDTLRNGATDYVLKDHISRLIPAVRRALAEAEEHVLSHQLQQRLREVARLEAVSTLSTGIAHDFNNILTIILGHASLLSMDHDRPQRVLEHTATIAAAARRASDVVQQLLAFAHKSEGHVVPTDINPRVEEALTPFRATLPRNIELSFEETTGLPPILADGPQLDRILNNVISNSIESMSMGGKLTVSTQLVTGGAVPDLPPEFTAEHYICIIVADTGSGMDAGTREHVFEPFFTTKERGRGTGLGLPVVYGLMQAHNGWIHIDSTPGRGTRVLLFFPVPRQKLGKAPASLPLADPTLSGSETILVVEDEADVSFFLQTILENHGYKVLLAHDYDQALPLFQAHGKDVDLVFSDVGLPRVDGITLCSKLRENKANLKVILTSGYSPKEFKDRLDDLHPETFLPKPYTTQTILRSVRDVLDRVGTR